MKRTTLLDFQKTSRREMLKIAGGFTALTNASLASTLLNLSATNSAVGQTVGLSGYKAMVCLFLFGGNDSYNMLTPLDTAEHADYVTARGGLYTAGNGALGIPSNELLSITDSNSTRSFGIHPSMPEMKTLYDAGKVTFLCNMGSLVAPTTMSQYQAQVGLPLGLFSHADLQRHWMTSQPETRSQVTGWAGRMADMVTGATNTNANISMNISLNNVNMLQTGGSVIPYIISNTGAHEAAWYGQTWMQPTIFRTLTDEVLARPFDNNLLEETFASQNRTALDAAIEFNTATGTVTGVDAFFPPDATSTNLQKQFKMVAKTIEAQSTLGQARQTFFVTQNGWDNHDELINNHSANLQEVSQALKNFQDAIDSISRTNDVVTFTASDFARTLSSNGQGSDHAWGGHQLIMGGPSNGGRIHGHYPETLVNPLAPSSLGGFQLDTGRGRLIPTTSVDEMSAELAMWYGVSNELVGGDDTMKDILPNIRNFVPTGTTYPIGFLT